jgi:hypothetical protein
MSQIHQPHFFTQEWFELHSTLAASLWVLSVAWGVGGVLVAAGWANSAPDWHVLTSPFLSVSVDVAVRDAPGSTGAAPAYFPAQFHEQSKAAPIEAFPDQF